MHLTLPILMLAGALTSWISGCAGRVAPVGKMLAAGGTEAECTVRETWRGPLKPATDQELYVEPDIMLESEGQVFITGRPTFLFGMGRGGADSLLSRNEVFGVIVHPNRTIEVVPNPLGTSFTMPLTAGVIRPGVWATIVAEVDVGPDTTRWKQNNDGDLTRFFYAEYSQGIWRNMEEVPVTDVTLVMARNGSQLVMHADTLVWALPSRQVSQPGVVVERIGDVWRQAPVDPGYATGTSYAQAIHVAGRGFLIGLVQPDTALRDDTNALFLYRRESTWVNEGKLVPGSPKEIHHPIWVPSSVYGSVMSWVNPSLTGGSEANAIWGTVGVNEVDVVVVDPIAMEEPSPLVEWPDGPYWISNRISEGSLHLRLSRARQSSMDVLWAAESPFTTSFEARTISDKRALVTGPLLNREAKKLTSLLIELELECPSPR